MLSIARKRNWFAKLDNIYIVALLKGFNGLIDVIEEMKLDGLT